MTLDKKYYIHTGKDGSLGETDLDTTQQDIDALVGGLSPGSRVAIIIHGGLVSKNKALETAEKLLPLYLEANVHPIFLVWETGPLETLHNLLKNVWKEGLFRSLVQKLLRHAAAKIGGELLLGAKDARGLPVLPNDIETITEYQKLRLGKEPFEHIKPGAYLPTSVEVGGRGAAGAALPRPALSLPVPAELDRLEDDLRTDRLFITEAEACARWLQDREENRTKAAQPEGPAKETLADPKVFFDPSGPGGEVVARAFFSPLKAIKHAVKVFVRVVSRYRSGRDHGLYSTVVEEVLREFYFTKVGAAIWGTMKRQASEAFASPQRGGCYLVDRLGAALLANKQLEVSLIAHSAGAVYACHLMNYVHKSRGNNVPKDFTFQNVVLLAPACDFRLFGGVLGLNPLPWQNFCLFALQESLESGYWEVPFIYPRSLLYLVSGAFEKEVDGATGAFDLPLVGMQRFHSFDKTYTDDEFQLLRKFLAAGKGPRAVWSVFTEEAGLAIDTRTHGEFFRYENGEPTQAMRTVVQLLMGGTSPGPRNS